MEVLRYIARITTSNLKVVSNKKRSSLIRYIVLTVYFREKRHQFDVTIARPNNGLTTRTRSTERPANNVKLDRRTDGRYIITATTVLAVASVAQLTWWSAF